MDPATEDWIIRLAGRIAAKRALLVLTYRPGYRPFAQPDAFTPRSRSRRCRARRA